MIPVAVVGHVHLHPGEEGKTRRLPAPRSPPLMDELQDGIPIRNDKTVVFPAFFQDFGQRIAVGRGRGAADVVEGAHQRGGPGPDPSLEGRKIGIPQGLARDLGRHVVPTAQGGPVSDVVFQTGGNAQRVGERRPLKSPHCRGTEHGVGMDILAETLGNAAPTPVARHINHRGEGPLDTRETGLACRLDTGRFNKPGIPRTGLRQRDGENGSKSMHRIVRKEDRNTQPGLLHGPALHPVPHFGAGAHIDQRPDFRRQLRIDRIPVIRIVVAPQRVLIELEDLLLQRHSGEQVLDPLLHGKRRLAIGRHFGPESAPSDRQQQRPDPDFRPTGSHLFRFFSTATNWMASA